MIINLRDMLTENRNNSTSKGCLMAMVSKEDTAKILQFSKQLINDEDLYLEGDEYGRETESHVTIRYGFLKDLNELEIRQLLKNQKPFMMEIFGLDKFVTPPQYDVAVFKVNSPVLKKLNELSGVYLNENDYPEYIPHLTLAYVQKGKFNHLMEGFKLQVPVKTICYSPISGAKSYFDLEENTIHKNLDASKSVLDSVEPSIDEIEYPLAKKGELQSYEGHEGWKGKLVWMAPQKFLSLCYPLPDYEMKDASYWRLRKRMRDQLPIDFLVLKVDSKRNKVVGHEGRHRATVAKEMGVEKVPVLIYFEESYPRVPKWGPEHHSVVDKAEFKPEWEIDETYKGGIPRYLYHATYWEVTPNIFEKGLNPALAQYVNYDGNEKGVYLTPDKQLAISMVETSENENVPEDWLDDIVLLTIDIHKLDDKKLFEEDPHWLPGGKNPPKSFLYRGVIPPDAIVKMEDQHGKTIPKQSSSQLGL